MARQYAPAAGTSSTSPGATGGSGASVTSTSVDSQYLPATVTRPSAGASGSDASSTSYRAPYSLGRMLSPIPPSIATYRRTPGMSLIAPTVYSATPAGPAMERPGSTTSSGACSPRRAAPASSAASSVSTNSRGDGGSSSRVYAIPRPPPAPSRAGSKPTS